MANLIDKDALVLEIRKRLLPVIRDKHYDEWEEGQDSERQTILGIINALEVKEVDLEKELDTWRHNHFHGRRDKEASGEYLERITQLGLAEHFFELGLKAQKGE